MSLASAIAITGVGGVFPGALTCDALWSNLAAGRSSLRATPPERWILPPAMAIGLHGPSRVAHRIAGIVDPFDLDLTNLDLDPERVAALDPVCHFALHAGRDAWGSTVTEGLDRARVGVALAALALPTDAASALTRELYGPALAARALGREPEFNEVPTHPLNRWVTTLPAALLAGALGLGGGTLTLDAACASGLYAIRIACEELLAGRADAMLAGGVSRPDALFTQMGFEQLRALSPSGRCAPFAAQADGLVVGEGAAVFMLKRVEDAVRADDRILGLIRAVGLSNDLSGSLLAPDSEGQVRAMRAAYDAAGWRPSDVDAIECHGTGTPVGDAVEIRSYRELRAGEKAKRPCVLGSVKSALGHTLTAAGAIGLAKMVMAMQHGQLVPMLNFDAPNPACELESSTLKIPCELQSWERSAPSALRRAAVSAFGFGGINAHLLLEEWNPSLSREQDRLAGEPSLPMFVAERAEPARPVAIVGMALEAGPWDGLRRAQEALLRGDRGLGLRPPGRRPALEGLPEDAAEGATLPGAWRPSLDIPLGRYRMPPNEMGEILPQQLWMLTVADAALADAGIEKGSGPHRRAGALIGMDFDLNATNYGLRWWAEAMAPGWAAELGLVPGTPAYDAWLRDLLDAAGPALDSARVVGALGNILANRIAREFGLGGASFALSAGEASGLRALEFAVRSIQRGELDWAVAGAVDWTGDLRHLKAMDALVPWSRTGERSILDAMADGDVPGEAAVALVVKPLDAAQASGDRIYATITGLGFASGEAGDAIGRAWADAGDAARPAVDLIELGGAAKPGAAGRAGALTAAYGGDPDRSIALGSLAASAGHAGAAAGLASMARTALALYQAILPALPGLTSPPPGVWDAEVFHAPRFPQVWLRNRVEGPRRAAVDVRTVSGETSHWMLEEVEPSASAAGRVAFERRQPLGARPVALFGITGDGPDDFTLALSALGALAAAHPDDGLEALARRWFATAPRRDGRLGLALILEDLSSLGSCLTRARTHLTEHPEAPLRGDGGVFYDPAPFNEDGRIAFVFPGSGNHYVGMGRGLRVHWPELLRELDAEFDALRAQLMPRLFLPCRLDWPPGWAADAERQILAHPRHLLFGQVAHSCAISDLLRGLGFRPDTALGYSLGESKSYFAFRAWRDRDRMLRRMTTSPLFETTLAGPCEAARAHWGLAEGEPAQWCAAVVNRPAGEVRAALAGEDRVDLLIVNTPGECVIGGRSPELHAFVDRLECEFIELEGVPSVHCSVAAEAEEAYRELHQLPTDPPRNVVFYSVAAAAPHELTMESCADSITAQALKGFDFPAAIEHAYAAGVKTFIEIGPRASCSRMIARTLGDRPHMARSACIAGEDDLLTVFKLLGESWSRGVWRGDGALYGEPSPAVGLGEGGAEAAPRTVSVALDFALGEGPARPDPEKRTKEPEGAEVSQRPSMSSQEAEPSPSAAPGASPDRLTLAAMAARTHSATAKAHQAYLDFVKGAMAQMGAMFGGPALDATGTPETGNGTDGTNGTGFLENPSHPSYSSPAVPPAAYPREACMAFAIGTLAEVLGPEFAPVDACPVRVRFPGEPLMLCDRILTVEGEKGSMTQASCVTEHDVRPGAWYLDQDRAPACITIEAGQADLFLCSYLGIDLEVMGKRAYRLLNADVTFHRGLPRPGDVLRYHIHLDRFIRQGDVTLFCFRYEGTVNGEPMISMRNGRAGFFTSEEIEAGVGIVHKAGELDPAPGRRPGDWRPLAAMQREAYDDGRIGALRRGDLAGCFGPEFARFQFADPPRLPEGRMRLLDRVTELDPAGGRFGLGLIVAEYDVHPGDWFLTCHFVDDPTMPGTLMYQCCEHTLRVFLWRMGWVCDQAGVAYEPRAELEAKLVCRGPVTPATQMVTYEIHIKELGYGPEPFAIVDAYMYSDGKKMVQFEDMSMQLTGVSRETVEGAWLDGGAVSSPSLSTSATVSSPSIQPLGGAPMPAAPAPAIFDKASIIEFCEGDPSKAFGEPLRPFDRDQPRKLARLPRDPFRFIDRVTRMADAPPWELKAGACIDTQFDITGDDWFWRAGRQPAMPFAVLLEHGLQGCGWLAAYGGAALRSEERLRFRNLGGTATLLRDIPPGRATLTTRLIQTSVSEAGGMIIVAYDFQTWMDGVPVYDATTQFGFFTEAALAQQVGLRDAGRYEPTPAEIARQAPLPWSGEEAPVTPADPAGSIASGAALPARAMRMIEDVELYIPDGGPAGLGFVRGIKPVDPAEWFFQAHFFEDPVVPGSLGLESMLQLMKQIMLARWPQLAATHRFEAMATGLPHTWVYRGQVVPTAKLVTTEAVVTRIENGPAPLLVADGLLICDGLPIYGMKDFALRLVPVEG